MPFSKKDYIEQMIEQLAEALQQVFKLRRAKKLDQATQQVRSSALELLGMEYGTLLAIDAATAVQLLGAPHKVRALAQLIAAEAEVLVDQGQPDSARDRLQHALALLSESAASASKRPEPHVTLETEIKGRLEKLG